MPAAIWLHKKEVPLTILREMEFEERKTNPESTRDLLVQQVEEQSEFCDVTVKMGLWEKKFHKCVLVVSPFFSRMLKYDFIEKQTGELDVTIGTPASLEMAVMFLYGKKPKLTHQNVEHIVEMAEFLLIPNLKAACVSWLTVVDITEDNCMALLQLASIYEFDMPECLAYIREHMSEMLQHAQMINLTHDSVKYLLSDIKLSYVAIEEKVRFLVRWLKANIESRTESAMELSKCIDFEDASPSLLEELRLDATINKLIAFGDITGCTGDNSSLHSVLLMLGNNSRSFTCFDLKRERWFSLDSAALKQAYYQQGDIIGVRSGHSEIYFFKHNYHSCTILTLNIERDDSRSQRVLLNDSINFQTCRKTSMNSDIFVGCAHESVRRKINKRMDISERPILQHHVYLKAARYCYTNCSVLYMGHVSDAADIELSPILTLLDEDIEHTCVNEQSTVAMVPGSRKHLVLFDLVEYKMEKIKLKINFGYKLVATDDGFLLHNNKRCVYIVGIIGPNLSKRHIVTEVELENNPTWDITYQFCFNTLFRYIRRGYKDSFTFECARHVDVIAASCPEGVTWKRLPLPNDDSQCNSETISDRFVQILLSKGKLRCHPECPHCNMTNARGRETYRYLEADDDYDDDRHIYYEDWSDDDIYSPTEPPTVYYDYATHDLLVG